MATIKLTDPENNKEYTLGFSKKTVKEMARNGFDISKAVDNYVIGIPDLFTGAFLRYHRGIKQNLVDELWEMIPNKAGLTEKLVTMFNEQLDELFSDPEDDAKKVMWEEVQ